MSLPLHPPPTSLWCGLVEACRECTVSTYYFLAVSFLLNFLFFTSVQTGGALLNRLIVSRGITTQLRPLRDCLQTSRESPVYHTLSPDPLLLQSAAVHLAHDLTHTHPHTPWHNLTWIFYSQNHKEYKYFSVLVSVSMHKKLVHIHMKKSCKHMTCSVQRAIVQNAFSYE